VVGHGSDPNTIRRLRGDYGKRKSLDDILANILFFFIHRISLRSLLYLLRGQFDLRLKLKPQARPLTFIVLNSVEVSASARG